VFYNMKGRGSSDDIAASYGLCSPGIESRRGRNFHTVPEAHSASYTVGTGSLSRG
jgi:hypothetical protein